MGSKGAINVTVKMGREYESEACEFARVHPGWKVSADKDGSISIETYSDDASYLDNELDYLGCELGELAVPACKWTAEVCFESYESPNEDGSIVVISIANGSIQKWLESTTRFVEKEPWADFELK